jgi:putative transcriptional regulator
VFNRIAVLRAERAISRKELAAAVGVNFQTIGYLERDEYRPSVELALKLSQYFGLPLEMVFSLKPFAPISAELLEAKLDRVAKEDRDVSAAVASSETLHPGVSRR